VSEFIVLVFAKKAQKTLVFYDWKRAFWACFSEIWVFKFVHIIGILKTKTPWIVRNSGAGAVCDAKNHRWESGGEEFEGCGLPLLAASEPTRQYPE
jgi:hypothetical protein